MTKASDPRACACPSLLVMHFSVSVSIWRVFSLTSSKSSFILVNSSITPCLVSRWILEYSFVPFVALRHRTHLSVVCLSPFARQAESLEFLLRNGARIPFMFVRFCLRTVYACSVSLVFFLRLARLFNLSNLSDTLNVKHLE